jgi:hypothetical protein
LIEKIKDRKVVARKFDGRQPNPGVKDFCVSYGLEDDIFEILFHIFYWDRDGDLGTQIEVTDLTKAISLIKEYIKNHDPAAVI